MPVTLTCLESSYEDGSRGHTIGNVDGYLLVRTATGQTNMTVQNQKWQNALLVN